MSKLTKKIAAGIGANAYGQVANVAIQLVSLPIFLQLWSLEKYGTWLVLSAIPAYFSMADVGMVTVAANRMTMLMSRGDHVRANIVFQSAQMFLVIVCAVVAVLSILIILWIPSPLLNTADVKLALILLILNVLAAFCIGLALAVYRATNRYASGEVLGVHARIFVWICGMLGLAIGREYVSVAAGMLAGNVIAVGLLFKISAPSKHHLNWGKARASFDEVRAMVRPSIGLMSFPLANALSLQGLTLLAAYFLGPTSVAIFNTYRTLARVATQLTSVFSHALWPELSKLHGTGQKVKFRSVLKSSTNIGTWSALALSLVMYVASPWLLTLWSAGQIGLDHQLMIMLLLYAAVAGAWHVPRIALMATNSHSQLGAVVVGFSVICILVAWPLALKLNLLGLAAAMLFSELAICATCMWLTNKAYATDTAIERGN